MTMHLLLLLSLLVVIASCDSNVISSNYFEDGDIMCDVLERVDRQCSSTILNTRSLVHCMSLCELDKSCIGASLDENGMCFHHKECPMISGCVMPNTQHQYKKKYCAHGSWDIPTQECKCVDGFYGEQCKQCLAKCSDLIGIGYEQGIYRVYLDPEQNGLKPFPVICYIKPSSDYGAVQMLFSEGVRDFNKSWVDYVNGFYYDDENFWGGLYAWHRLSENGCTELTFVFKFTMDNVGTLYRTQSDFVVSSEINRFSFTFGNLSPPRQGGIIPTGGFHFGDCLGPLQNVPFSTWDADHDGNDDDNCAARAGSGWWYSGCNNPCNALGFGIQYLNTMPQHQVFSLLGVDMDQLSPEEGTFIMYLKCP